MNIRILLSLLPVGSVFLVSRMAWSGPVDFNAQIRPILTTHCTGCHGGVKAAGGISFVYREKALAAGKSGEPAIVPGKPELSELMKRIVSKDPDEVMPKPEHGPPLKAEEVAVLGQWITEGAQWSELWSLVPPQPEPLPVVKDTAWPAQPLDFPVLAKLEKAARAVSAAAKPGEWLRRVSLDLVGLPPSMEEFAAFQKAYAQDPKAAKAAVVDRLLASPQFGEHWASMWLDLARYADTFGYEKDPHRDIWPWRDWVIRSLNADMPYDVFTQRQLAGDLLPNATAEDLLATAFHRNTQNNTEGGTNDEEFRSAAVVDRVNTTWTAWMATTFGCVQCHSHPYDPYPHEDYYKFMAFFDNTEDADIDSDHPRMALAKDTAMQDKAHALAQERDARRAELNDSAAKLLASDTLWKNLVPAKLTASHNTAKLEPQPDGRVKATGNLPVGISYTIQMADVAGLTALRLEILPDSEDPKNWPERATVLSHLTLAKGQAAEGQKQPVVIKDVVADYLVGPFDPRDSLDAKNGGFGSFPGLYGKRWCVLLLEKPLELAAGEVLELGIKQSDVSNANQQACTLRHFQLKASTDAAWTALAADAKRQQAYDELAKLEQRLRSVPAVKVPVLRDRPTAGTRGTRVWTRGNRLTKDQEVSTGLPKLLSTGKAGKTDEAPLNRLHMAKWLTQPEHPLTARVMANRLWAGMFGHGIVETLEDFGTSGARPSNQALLDLLAVRFSGELKWSVKSLLREIALSSTYGQTAASTAEAVTADPTNQWLARGPRQRLSAEMVRDHALKISGLLSGKSFGPPVYPPQPEGVWNSVYSGAKWDTSQGEDRYRRAIYTYVKRTSGYPGFLTFDAPQRDLCTARRLPTNTPLQALVTMNDPAFLEMAQALAKTLAGGGGTVADQIARGCRWITLEDPPEGMVAALVKLYGQALTEYQAKPELSKKIAETPEMAALALVANTLFNTDLALSR